MSREVIRCGWCKSDPLYIQYHDREWGVPVFNDQQIFESLILETFQAGLSWIIVLKKREEFRKAFDGFDVKKIAKYQEKKIEILNKNRAIIRNTLKIKATKTNAIAFIRIQEEFGNFSKYLWGFVNGIPIKNNFSNINEIPKSTDLSEKISKELKNRGFQFVGPTVIYSHMQAIGMVNDHATNCFRHQLISSSYN